MLLRTKNSDGQPKLIIGTSQFDKFLEVAGWAVLLLLWFYTIYGYSDLPETIPTHFNAAGQPDDFGSRTTLFLLPIIGTVLFIGLTSLVRKPQVFNFPVVITEKNAKMQYTMAVRLIRFLKLALLLIFTVIIYRTQLVALGKSEGLGVWFLPFTLGIIFIPTGLFIIKSLKYK